MNLFHTSDKDSFIIYSTYQNIEIHPIRSQDIIEL